MQKHQIMADEDLCVTIMDELSCLLRLEENIADF